MDEVRGPAEDDGAKSDCNGETRRHRMERFALKRKFASLSSRLDRAHREVLHPFSSACFWPSVQVAFFPLKTRAADLRATRVRAKTCCVIQLVSHMSDRAIDCR